MDQQHPKNEQHLKPELTTTISALPPEQRQEGDQQPIYVCSGPREAIENQDGSIFGTLIDQDAERANHRPSKSSGTA